MDFEIIAIFDLRLIKHIFKSNEITWNNLIIHGPFELESMFLEICNPKKRFTTGKDVIKNDFFLIIFRLTGTMPCLHEYWQNI